jgi:hypothetical protein
MGNLLKVLWLSLVLIFLGILVSSADEIKPASLPNQDTTSYSVQGDPSLQNEPPELTCPEDDSVHAGDTFVSTLFSATDPNGDDVEVSVLDIDPPAPANPTVVASHIEWWTVYAPVGDYLIRLVATDPDGLKDTCQFTVQVQNQRAELTCPEDDSVSAGQTFISTDFSVYDAEGDPVSIRLLGITPKPTHYPSIVDSHVVWNTSINEEGDYLIRLLASEDCFQADTCEFTVTVISEPFGQITCPEDDSVHAEVHFVSTDFSITGPGADPANVTICSIVPSPVNIPVIVDSHVEWQTDCDDTGKVFTICLEGPVGEEIHDTCHFEVTVYNRPPELTCPENGNVQAGKTFISTDFSVIDPDGDTAPITFLDITPSAANDPVIVDDHVEWITTSSEDGDYIIHLGATDPCGLADTCNFTVNVTGEPVGELTCPEDDSVHAEVHFVSTDFSITGPGADPANVTICGVVPTPVNMPTIVDSHVEWQTDCADTGKAFNICLEGPVGEEIHDTCHFEVTVYNRPPELTCPENGNVQSGHIFISTDFSVLDPDGDPAPVTFLDITPSAANDPFIVDSHIEWATTASDLGDYVIRLFATDPCRLKDTCRFTVTVHEPTSVFECPEDDSVHAGDYFVSTNFTLTHPDCDPSSVEILSISPGVTHYPFISGYHIEWQTTCTEDGDYTITLITNESCSVQDTCSFMVTVYNRPPNIICPDYGTVQAMHLFISTDFHTSDPDGDDVAVSLLGIDPPAEHDPVIVERHVEWQTECVLGNYIITLIATDPCGLADTCAFMVTVTMDPVPDFYIWVYPVTQYVSQGHSIGYLVELNSLHGFAQPCSLHVSGLPSPPDNAVFDQVVMTPTDFTTMMVYTLPQTDTGTYTLTVTGKEIFGPRMHSAQVYLKVMAPLDAGDDPDNPNVPPTFALFQNQPNPFNPKTQISYRLPETGKVSLTVYNVLGRRIKTLFDGHQSPGIHSVSWDGRDENGQVLSSGIYFYRLQADGFEQTKRMLLMK